MDLNREQALAAEHLDGPVAVFAGPGTGKTRTLVARIVNLLTKGISPDHILAITFTNKAAREMKDRITQEIGPEARPMVIRTIHSFCAAVLRQHIDQLGYSRYFSIIDDSDQVKIIKDIIDEHEITIDLKPRQIASMIGYLKLTLKASKSPELAQIKNRYQSYLKTFSYLDFEDILVHTKTLFEKHPEILSYYQNKYQYICVDEFQDIDILQYQIIKMLGEPRRNIFIVGDDDQAIYSFRGASSAIMQRFLVDYPETFKVVLTVNYRSPQEMLIYSNRFIAHNHVREAKDITSNRSIPGAVQAHLFKDSRDEVKAVMMAIDHHLASGYNYSDIAILYRYSFLSNNLENELIARDYRYRVFGGPNYLDRTEIKNLIGYLRYAINNEDFIALRRIINVPRRGIGATSLENIEKWQRKHKTSLRESLDQVSLYLKKRQIEGVKNFLGEIDRLSAAIENETLPNLFKTLLDVSNYRDYIYSEFDNPEERWLNVLEFQSIMANIEDNGEIATRAEKLISAFDEALLDTSIKKADNRDSITLSTIHSAKGLEFPIVFLIGCEKFILDQSDEAYDSEEERRVMYVAVTRAQEKFYISASHRRFVFGGERITGPSQFFQDYAPDEFRTQTAKLYTTPSKPDVVRPRFSPRPKPVAKPETRFKVGEKVVHKTYGQGIVVGIQDDGIGQICFVSKGVIKKFDLSHPAIEKYQE